MELEVIHWVVGLAFALHRFLPFFGLAKVCFHGIDFRRPAPALSEVSLHVLVRTHVDAERCGGWRLLVFNRDSTLGVGLH